MIKSKVTIPDEAVEAAGAKTMAEVLEAHSSLQWSFEYGGFVCVECGWQETYARPYEKDAEASARSNHLTAALSFATSPYRPTK